MKRAGVPLGTLPAVNWDMHPRKKNGERKDKKNHRMHEAVDARHAAAKDKPKERNDNPKDIQTFKPGSANDRSAPPH